MNESVFSRWQANFWAGLVILMPAVISIGVLVWLFGTVANITDTLLFFLPDSLTHQNEGLGPVHWYWSLVALVLAAVIIALVGLLARHYIGKRAIMWLDLLLLRVPLLNKIYGAIKQVNDAFSNTNKTAFRTVVLVEFPYPGSYSLGFITNEEPHEVEAKTGQKTCCVFMPTTPNPTSGFLLLVPVDRVKKLEMSIQDGIKYVISLGAIMPNPGKAVSDEGTRAVALEAVAK